MVANSKQNDVALTMMLVGAGWYVFSVYFLGPSFQQKGQHNNLSMSVNTIRVPPRDGIRIDH
jgi:hypothetical protein